MRWVVCLTAVAAALAGCGGGESPQSGAPPAPSAATQTPPPATATPTSSAAPTATVQPLPSVSGEGQPAGAGDEEPIRVPAQFTVTSGAVDPPQVAVPAFLAIQLIVKNERTAPMVVRLEGARPLTVAAHDTGTMVVEGRKRGRYAVDFGNGQSAVLIIGAQPGP